MADRAAGRTGRYLYAVVDGRTTVAGDLTGIDGSQVYAIDDGHLAAVVSDVPDQKLRPERRHLAAHQGVLKRLLEAGSILPMSFGVIADSAAAVERLLARNRDNLGAQLRRVEGKVEMGLRVRWDVPNIFAYFADVHPELKAVRNRLFGSNRELTRDEKIELGQLFERLLNQDRRAHAQKVEGVLASRCAELRHSPPRSEYEVMNLACLIDSQARAAFEAGVFEAARLFDDHFAFDYTGPWAPHNFVDVDLEI
jgi:hypothetical protein